MTDGIGEGHVTKSFLEHKLQEYFKTKSKLVHAEGDVVSKGLGFTSDVLRVNLTWDPEDNGLPKKVMVKAPKIANMQTLLEELGAADAAQASAKFIPMAHAVECKAYTMFGANNVLPLPKVYGYCLVSDTEPGMVIMEDLNDKGGLIANVAHGLTLEQWRSVAEALADLHGWSLATDVPWQNEFPGAEMMFEMMKGFMAVAPANAKAAVEKYPEYLGHVDLDFLTKQLSLDNMLQVMMSYKQIMPDVLTHGDTWINNIFFEKKSDGSLNDRVVAFIDWHGCSKSCGILDLTRFEGWCVNHEMRRKNAKSILRCYYDRLKQKAGDRLTATYDQIEELYDRFSLINGIFGVTAVELFLHKIAKVHEDPTGMREKEMLERLRAAYDDAIAYIKSHENSTKQ